MLPEGWRKCQLESLVYVVDSLHKTPKFSDEGFPMVRVTDIKNGRLLLDSAVKVSKSVFEEFSKNHKPQYGDIIFSRVGSFGIPAYVDTNAPFCLGQNTIVISPGSEIDSKFLYNMFLSTSIQSEFMRTVDGSSQKTLSLKTIKSIEIPLPPLAEQQKIAKILSTWDEAIEKLEVLHNRCYAEFNLVLKKSFSSSLETTECTLEEVADIIMGSSPKSEAYNDNKIGLPLIQGNADIINRKTAPRQYTSLVTKECKKDDIVLSVRAPVGEVAWSVDNACLGRGVAAIRAKNQNEQRCLYYALVSSEDKWKRISQGSTFESINSGDVKSFQFFFPKSQEDIIKVTLLLQSMDRRIEILKGIISLFKKQKQGLTQQLLTGKKRVRV